MKQGIIGLISLLLGVLILVIFFVFIGTKLSVWDKEAVTTTNPEKIQEQVDDLQNQLQQKQNNTTDDKLEE